MKSVKPEIISRKDIERIINKADIGQLMGYMEEAFVSYTSGAAVVPPVGSLSFQSPPGEVHIKYGYIKNDAHYVIKIASGFYENPALGLPSSNGMNLVFKQRTGELEAILLDEGLLTDVRTALAGAVAAKYLAPEDVNAIGIMGTGTQAKMQLRYLKHVVDCRQAMVWGRSGKSLNNFKKAMKEEGFNIKTTQDSKALARNCNLIVTATPATSPILLSDALPSGVHITAVGADTEGKQELDPAILDRAGMLVVDSFEQCRAHGEIHKAVLNNLVSEDRLIEMGEVIEQHTRSRKADDITIADLTGIATQDIQISRYVLEYAKSL